MSRPDPASLLAVLALLLAACGGEGAAARTDAPAPAPGAVPAAGEPTAQDLEFLHWPITMLDELDGGIVAIGLGPMARVFVIHPELSPDHAALVAFARSAHGAGQAVHATAWIRDRPSKAPPQRDGVPFPFVIVRLAQTPDPREPR